MKKTTTKKSTRKVDGRFNLRQATFVKNYLTNGFHEGQAAMDAGYSPHCCSQIAQRLLNTPHIKERIDAERERIQKKYEVTADKVVGELALLGFSNMQDYIRTTPDGGAVIDLSRLTRQQAAAIKKLESEVYVDHHEENDDGEREPVNVKRTKLELADKRGALELLGKYAGVFTEAASGPRQIKIQVVYEDANGSRHGVNVEVDGDNKEVAI